MNQRRAASDSCFIRAARQSPCCPAETWVKGCQPGARDPGRSSWPRLHRGRCGPPTLLSPRDCGRQRAGDQSSGLRLAGPGGTCGLPGLCKLIIQDSRSAGPQLCCDCCDKNNRNENRTRRGRSPGASCASRCRGGVSSSLFRAVAHPSCPWALQCCRV